MAAADSHGNHQDDHMDTPEESFPAGVLPTALVAAAAFLAWAGLPDGLMAQAPKELPAQQVGTMTQIRITIEDAVITATLDDNATARDFLSLLPMTLTLEDYNSTEKIGDLPRRLSTDGAPEGIDPTVGDITYYAPWGNLALFYEDFGYSKGLVRLGRIESELELLKRPGALKATIERAD